MHLGQHHVMVEYCACHTKVERLFQLGLWPATPSTPKLAFTTSLFDLIHSMTLECQVSLHDICRMLHMIHSIHQQEVNTATMQQL